MKLFDEFARSYKAPAGYGEPDFDYLNRSANEPIVGIRDLLEDWFSRYPTSEKRDLRQRFRSRNESNHSSAFYEMWLHELMICLGCSVNIHPTLSATNRKPDFLVRSPQGCDFYLEAIYVSGESVKQAKSNSRQNAFYDSLNYLKSPDFFINLDVKGSPASPVPAKKIRNWLEHELSQLNPRLVDHFLELRRIDLIPRWRFEHEGWKITCYPTPKPPELRGVPGVRTLATISFGGIIDSESPIRDAVLSKAKRYGVLDLPFVVAVNASDQFISDRDVLTALYGSVSGWNEPELLNDSRGVWGSVNRPVWTRVSAVLVTMKLRPCKISGPACLYHNPWPRKPYIGELTRLSQIIPVNNRLRTQRGEGVGSILGLPEDLLESH